MEDWQKYISINPEIRSGKPCVSGTRITVSDVLSYLAAGMSMEEIIVDFPALDKEKIIATLSFAAYRDKITTIAFAS
ncbi:Uncharacterized conserved protein, DUF433 family [Flavobacterium omnivorum]|jgi:uncharacterized protein (DUF433 family)|uniref:Uncharacterized conserved protein, DUF433 family n=1 Tax=Flavobacterium omnivorum TaxID=178355 RepID=A0A1G8CLU0_9FLAO|nr:DUF433 domain-containing protein [Flavobacterium omnivorum]SDH46438.1 Uncharacterized conserved protein, DUF433 family [Flavobacterium omnivorum]